MPCCYPTPGSHCSTACSGSATWFHPLIICTKLVLVKMDVQDAEGMHVLVGHEWEQELVVQLTLLELSWQRVA